MEFTPMDFEFPDEDEDEFPTIIEDNPPEEDIEDLVVPFDSA
jgi:hypothetical protein